MMEAPKLPTIFKQRKTRSFDFKPRYYDERKERIEELKKKYNNNADGQSKSRADFRYEMSSEWRGMRSGNIKNSNSRLFAIIVVLTLLTYLIISY